MANRFEWSEPLTKTLRDMRDKGDNLDIIAERIGVDRAVVHRRARELGIAGRLNHGRKTGRQVMEERRNG